MPVMDGLEATRQIRNLSLEKQPKIVAMTAHAMKEDKARCLEAGMDAYLSKPINFDQVNVLLQENLATAEAIPDQQTVTPEAKNTSLSECLAVLRKDTGFDENTARQLVQEGLSSWKEEMVQIEERLKNKDLPTIKAKLHQMNGSASNLRIKPIAFLAKQAEKQLNNQEWKLLARTVQEIEEQLIHLEES